MDSNIPRRSFLSAGGLSMAALAAASPGLPEAQVNDPADASPSGGHIRFGIIGIGMEGSDLLANAITLPGIECVAGSRPYDGGTRSPSRSPAIRTCQRRAAIDELLERKDIDCISPPFPIFGTSA